MRPIKPICTTPRIYLILVAGCQHGDFLRLLISEGVAAQGVERDAALAEACREQELPVSYAVAADYLDQLENGSLGGIYLSAAETCLAPRELGRLIGQCWRKLEKNGVLIAEAANPLGEAEESKWLPQLQFELLSFLLDSQSFTIVDLLFSTPADRKAGECEQAPGRPFDRKQYRHYAVIGRK